MWLRLLTPSDKLGTLPPRQVLTCFCCQAILLPSTASCPAVRLYFSPFLFHLGGSPVYRFGLPVFVASWLCECHYPPRVFSPSVSLHFFSSFLVFFNLSAPFLSLSAAPDWPVGSLVRDGAHPSQQSRSCYFFFSFILYFSPLISSLRTCMTMVFV